MSSSLNTLLEAAKFLEEQEAASAAPAPTRPPVLVAAPDLLTLARQSAAIVIQKPEQQAVVSSTTAAPPPRRILHNSFDIMNPLVIDEGSGGEGVRRRQPPLVFRAGTREVHNKLEKHRRAHLKECFDVLKKQLPAAQDEKKTSNLSILHSALRYIQSLKRKERELEHEMERLAREKIAAQQKLATLKRDISAHFDNVDFTKILPNCDEVVAAAAADIVKIEPADVDVSDAIVKIEPSDTPTTIVVTSSSVTATNPNNGISKRILPILPTTKTHISIATTQVGGAKEVCMSKSCDVRF